MTKITIEEFNQLEPREIRNYFGIGPVTRIIKYIQEGKYTHRREALKTLNYWLKGWKWNEEELDILYWAIPYIIEKFPQESKHIRYEMAVTLHMYLNHCKMRFGDDLLLEINRLINKEKDKEVKEKLKQIIDAHKFWSFFYKKNKVFYLSDRIDRSQIEESEFYQTPLPFRAGKRKKVSRNDISCVYFLQEKINGYIKIGKTKNLKTKVFFPYKMPFQWEVIHTIESNYIDSLEKYFHKRFQHKQVNGEW